MHATGHAPSVVDAVARVAILRLPAQSKLNQNYMTLSQSGTAGLLEFLLTARSLRAIALKVIEAGKRAK